MPCTGACCAVFSYLDPAVPRFDGTADSAFIKDMLIPLNLIEAADRLVELNIDPPKWADTRSYTWEGVDVLNTERRIFTCKHWDTESRLCTVYEKRPLMCKMYPYERECEWCGSTQDGVTTQ